MRTASISSSRDGQISINHYTGQKGLDYFDYQSRFGDVAGRIIARKFAPHISASDVVLDLGCGGGFVLKALKCRQRLGVEINPAARAVAVQNRVTCVRTLDEIPDGCADVAISHHCLEHVASPLLMLRELQAKIKPGGLLLIVVPIDDWRTQKKYDAADINHHLYTWTPLLLGHLLAEAGFDIGTLRTVVRGNGWFRGYQKLYGFLPNPLFDFLSCVACLRRRTREIYGVVRKAQCGAVAVEQT